MFSQLIKLFLIFVLFAIVMIAVVRNKKMKYGWLILGIFLPVITYFLCETLVSLIIPILASGDGVLGMVVCDTVEWIICAVVCVIAGLIIFKTAVKSKDSIIKVFIKDYKKWNILVMVLIVLGVAVIIAEGIDFSIHQEEYLEALFYGFESGNLLDSISVLPVNMKLFALLRKISGAAMLAGFMVPSVILARKTETKNEN
ncbi:MAG: hypothetical protein IJD31_04800 [Lachnospiraceae bacterium]|nr:hypothetical protein [Lachnospiraceae bacterium]